MTTTELAVITPEPLTEDEKVTLRATMCDACGTSLIPSKYKVVLPAGAGHLFFCGHHLQHHEEALIKQGAYILS